MFTGLVEHLGQLSAIEPVPTGAALVVDASGWSHVPRPGESIAVNGCCLTVTRAGDPAGAIRFDVVPQTLRMTALGDLEPGAPINLEHAVTATTLMGGHVVQGHVDGVAHVDAVMRDGEEWRVRFVPPEPLLRFVVDKGSVAVDGVSLTVAAVDATGFEVALIPTTLEVTTLGRVEVGSRVNLETDYIVRAVFHWLETSQAGAIGRERRE